MKKNWWMAAIFFTLTLFIHSNPPIHKFKSGLTEFLTSTGLSIPFIASVTSFIENGFTTVRVSSHNISIPYFKACSACFGVATSTVVSNPVSALSCWSKWSPVSTTSSKPCGLVRGFHMPDLNTLTCGILPIWWAVFITCSSVSALHDPLMITACFWMAVRKRGFVCRMRQLLLMEQKLGFMMTIIPR